MTSRSTLIFQVLLFFKYKKQLFQSFFTGFKTGARIEEITAGNGLSGLDLATAGVILVRTESSGRTLPQYITAERIP